MTRDYTDEKEGKSNKRGEPNPPLGTWHPPWQFSARVPQSKFNFPPRVLGTKGLWRDTLSGRARRSLATGATHPGPGGARARAPLTPIFLPERGLPWRPARSHPRVRPVDFERRATLRFVRPPPERVHTQKRQKREEKLCALRDDAIRL